jgi:hypothetical protein
MLAACMALCQAAPGHAAPGFIARWKQSRKVKRDRKVAVKRLQKDTELRGAIVTSGQEFAVGHFTDSWVTEGVTLRTRETLLMDGDGKLHREHAGNHRGDSAYIDNPAYARGPNIRGFGEFHYANEDDRPRIINPGDVYRVDAYLGVLGVDLAKFGVSPETLAAAREAYLRDPKAVRKSDAELRQEEIEAGKAAYWQARKEEIERRTAQYQYEYDNRIGVYRNVPRE